MGKEDLSPATRPKKKIATLTVCWLEYNARWLNGRIYPKATCDAIFEAAKRKIAADDLPATVFVSHEAANSNGNMELVGHVSRVWQEQSKFYADLDLADTRASWDMVGLIENKAMRAESMRVAGVELVHSRDHDLPLVMCRAGVEPEFLGIDLTTRPGLADSARILQTLYESHSQNATVEAFHLDDVRIEIEKEKEAPPAMGVPIFMQVALGVLQEAMTPDRAAHQRVHDHLAGVMDSALKECHGSESARPIIGVSEATEAKRQLDESGRMIARKHAVTIAAAHDEAAKACGLQCEGCYKEALGLPPPNNAPSDTDNDGDNPAAGNDPDQDGESHATPPALTESKKENTILTEEEMLAALKAKGYAVEAPKSEAEKKLAALEARLAEQDAKIALLSESANGAPAQQKTLAAPSQFEESSTFLPETVYQEGDLMRGDLAPKNWRALSDRRVPWPHDKIDAATALHEMAPFLAFRMNTQEANAHGRDISQYIGANDEV